MKISKFFALPVIGVLFLTGCLGPGEPTKSPNEMVKEALTNMYDVTSYAYDLDLTGNIETGGTTLTLDLNFEGTQDLSSLDDLKFSMGISGKGSVDGEEDQSGEIELLLADNILYFMVSEISDFDGQLTDELKEVFVNKWWNTPLPEGMLSSFGVFGQNDDSMTEAEKEMKELFENTAFFGNVQYIDVDGGDYHYSAELDDVAVRNFLIEGSRINGEPATEQELADLDAALAMMNLPIELWIDPSDILVSKIAGDILIDSTLEGENVKFEFESKLSDFNKEVKMDIPEGSVEFNPLMLLGLGAMGAGGEVGEVPEMPEYEIPADMPAELPVVPEGLVQ